MDKFSHRERLQMIIAGETPDRFAASFWRHFFHMEHHCDGLVESMLAWQKEFDWDFMKINPRADFHIEDWGLKSSWSHDEFRKHEKLAFPVKTIDDWTKIKPKDLAAPALAEHLKAVAKIKHRSDRELPLLMTLFTPLGIAGRMIEDKKAFVEHLRTEPEIVESAIRAITDTFVPFASELRNAGADGLFYATLQWGSADWLTWDEYKRFVLPYDLEILQAAESDAINLFHVCGSNNHLKELTAVPELEADLWNWDDGDPTNLPMDKAMETIDKPALVGGVDHNGWLLHANPDEIARKIDELKDRFERSRLVIGPGCVVPPEVSKNNLHAIRKRL